MNTKSIFVIVLLAALGSACSDWLDIKPSDRVSEESAFSNLSGFKTALNGIYVELNRSELYGKALTSEFIEILAQRYDVGQENTTNLSVMNFEYDGSAVKSKISSIWSTAYNLIANTNLLLKNCEQNREVLTDDYYHLIKGEALALRGMLHFDLFRLFGPIYCTDSLETSIPYYKEFALDVAPSLQGTEFMAEVIDDLLEAEKELEGCDPILTFGVAGNAKDAFLQYRNLRLNYYAVQALLARAYLYMEDKAKAMEYAQKVIAIQESLFPWIDRMKIGNTVESPDRVFSSEVLFALQNINRNDIYTSLFDGQNLKLQTLLAPRADVIDYLFTSQEDYRRKAFLSSTVELNGTTFCIFNKYQGTDSLYNQMIPLIRVGESYLIASEYSLETEKSQTNALIYFNNLRNHRGLANLSSLAYWQIEDEYKNEFWGEGQLFFFYKRRNGTSNVVKSGRGNSPAFINVSATSFVLPIPDGELQYN